MKQHNKLVRDRILEIIEKDGVEYKSRILEGEEFKQELLNKIVEEAQEVLAAVNDTKELTKEIADVLEVIGYIIKTFELDNNEIQNMKQSRHDARGGFDKKIYLESTNE